MEFCKLSGGLNLETNFEPWHFQLLYECEIAVGNGFHREEFLDEAEDVWAIKSFLSIRATLIPCRASDSAMQEPVIPPPIIKTS